MKRNSSRISLAFTLYVSTATVVATYFGYAAVNGDLGVLERLVIQTKLASLETERDLLQHELDRLRTTSERLSDDHLDLDLLDERARATLGLMRIDELVIGETEITNR